jgi:hypothetical protein
MGHSAKFEHSYKIPYIICHKFRLFQAGNNNFITVNSLEEPLISSWNQKFKKHSFLCGKIKCIEAYDNILATKTTYISPSKFIKYWYQKSINQIIVKYS